MLLISISFTLLALIAGMLLLAKTKKEGLGKLFTWISYLVIVVSLLMLVCQGARGIMRMTCCRGMHPSSENCMMGRECGPVGGMTMHHCCMEGHGRCMEEMKECKMNGTGRPYDGMKGDSASCKMGMKHGCPMNMEKDSVKK